MNSETCFCIKNTNSVSSKNKVSLVPRPFYVLSARFYLEKGPVIQHLRACRIIPFFWNFVFFHIFSVYQWGVLRHEYMVESIVSESEATFMKPSPFPCLDWGSLVCL